MTKEVDANAFIYKLWEGQGYTYYSNLYQLYTSGFWPQIVGILDAAWFFPSTTIIFTMTNLLLVSF